MTAFNQFYRLIKPYADGVAGPAMDNALRQAAIRFCQETCAWQQISCPTPVTAGISTYDIDIPTDAEIVKLMHMTYDKRQIDPKAIDDLDAQYADWTTVTGVPACYTQLTPEQYLLVPIPSETVAQALSYRAAYKPSQGAMALPDILYRQYANTIARGALALLLMESNRGYFSAQEALRYQALFDADIDDAKIAVARSFTRAAKRTRGSFF